MPPEGSLAGRVNDDVRRTLLATVLLRRFGREEEVANACAYLVSDSSDYSTGAVPAIDGGARLEKGTFRFSEED